ncbi:CCCH-type zinc finger transcription factor, partial [Mucor lusitanicus CBS 277.49]
MYSSSEEEEYDCPLCMEELDIADRNFRPCPCGYQICRFCWHHIRENLNGRCPACRREYSDQNAEFEPISADEIARIKREKKEKERQQRDMDLANRRHLANMRVVQKNLVYIIGLHPKLATEETIRSADYFGHFGKIAKIVINKRQVAPTSHANGATSMQPSAAVYVTYVRKEDAAKAIHAVDGSVMAGRILRASYGTTKYCTYYLRNMTCPNPNCLYLHEPGEDADTISKEE